MSKVNIIIDGLNFVVDKSLTILEAALQNDIYIPNLCHHQDLKPTGTCRLCIVMLNGSNDFTVACQTFVEEGMSIVTDSPEINDNRKFNLELLHLNHTQDCTSCKKNNQCKLQEVTSFVGIDEDRIKLMRKTDRSLPVDNSNPFFSLDHNKCILCGICVRTCNEIQGVDALQYAYRGYDTVVSTFLNKKIKDSVCESCGECVVRCPVGALVPKNMAVPSRKVKTICPFCGVGCGIIMGARDQKVVSVEGDKDNPANKGNLCVKGRFSYEWINHKERLKKPLIKKSGGFIEVSWDEAIAYIAENFAKYKSDEFACFASARCTNEENYLLQKFTRAVMKTNNIDHCARLCHAPTVAGLAKTLGSGAMTNSIDEIENCKAIFAIGTNTTETHPVIGLRFKKAKQNGAKIIVANPKKIDLCRHADIFLQHKPGTDVALIIGMCKYIIEKKLHKTDFIKNKCEDYNSLKKSVDKYTYEEIQKIINVPIEKIKLAAEIFAKSDTGGIFYAMGVTQHVNGTKNVMAMSNLALLTGNVGKKSTGVNPLRGQNNVQGACDMGALPNVFPGYQKISDNKVIQKFNKKWKTDLSGKEGLTLTEIVKAALDNQVKALYLIGENSVLSEPDANKVKKALSKLDFFVAQDIFLSETAQLAHVVLPAASFAEKDGTFTNTERRVQRIRKLINPVGESIPDWKIICNIAKKMNATGFNFESAEDIFNEIADVSPAYKGINYQRIDSVGLQWPVKSKNHKGTKFLHKDKFPTQNGKALFTSMKYNPPAESSCKKFPFILTTERSLYHYHTGTMTRRVKGLNNLLEKEYVHINPEDAKLLNLNSDDKVLVSSLRGDVKAYVKITDKSPKGVVSMSFHFYESPTNTITNPKIDPMSKIPELKVAAVNIKKI